MIKHIFILIYRSFLRFKSTFLINLFGLSMGLACALFIYLWVNDELSVDKFHLHNENVFQLMGRNTNANGVEVVTTMAPVLAETVVEEMPEVRYAVMEARIPVKYTFSVNDKFFKEDGMYAGKDYFNVFSYNLIEGDKNKVLTGENSIAVSEPLARRLFNTTENVVGKLITLQDKGELIISGIFTVPHNSSYQFDFILPFALQFKHYPNLRNDWNNAWANAYVRLKDHTDVALFNKKIGNLIKQKSGQDNISLFTSRYADNYLYDHYENGIQAGGRIEYVKMFSIIAVFILVIACINFMNLSTAKATSRLKEIGIKKTIGADRKALIYQYMGESMVMTIVSVFFALMFVSFLTPQFNQLTGKNLSLNFDRNLIMAIIGITAVTGMVSGSYPALYLSGFNPVAVLKGKLQASFGEVLTRKGLIAFQFILSMTLITAVLVVSRQMDLIQNKNQGYSRDNVLYFEMEGKVKEHRDAFLSEVSKIPGVTHASSTFLTFFGNLNSTPDVSWQGKDPNMNVEMQYRRVNYDMIELLGIEMKAGTTFSKEVTSDHPAIIFNETAIRLMGLSDPVGETVNVWGKEMEIAGVTKDFHFESLHQDIKPLFFHLQPERTNTVMVKIEAGKVNETIARLQNYYEDFAGMPLDFKFLDEKFQAQYVAENRVSVLSRYFAGLAIAISCLGLYGLVMFTAERKTKEIGIRKILGSGNWGIMYFLLADFTRMIVAAIIIALPFSYWISNKWLDGFAYRIDLEWWFFIGSGCGVLLIAWLTMGAQALKATHTDPVKSLRSA
jgi:putative ABC transport system permease protein